jgi:hypothetical protein
LVHRDPSPSTNRLTASWREDHRRLHRVNIGPGIVKIASTPLLATGSGSIVVGVTYDDEERRWFAAAVGPLAVFFVAGVLVVIRDHVDNAVTALLLAVIVSACGLLGGRRAGVFAALMAALSFNFLHTRPYLSLHIEDADDVITALTLLVVGLMGGVAADAVARRGAQADDATFELRSLDSVARMVASGADPAAVQAAVRTELMAVLNLGACWFQPELPGHLPTLSASGGLSRQSTTYLRGGFELPRDGLVIPVVVGGVSVGGFVSTPTPWVGVSMDRRRTAGLLATLLAASLQAHPGRSLVA